MEINKIIKQPIFFERNRVYRIYTGGKPYPEFFGTNEEGDNFFPEEWVASNIKAINEKVFTDKDGISKVKGTDIYFDDLLTNYKNDLLGNRKYDCLVKILDSAVRLPAQVHPTKEFSLKNFNSPYGKTESWLVIKKRPHAKIFFGFKKPMGKDEVMAAFEKSNDDPKYMETVMKYKKARVNDCFLINAGLIHAIGAGCTVIEIQEPTDFTIEPEGWCAGLKVSESQKYLGLNKDVAFDCFNTDLYGKKAIKSASIKPKLEKKEKGYKKENLIKYSDTSCFASNRHTIKNGGSFIPSYGPSVWICLEGKALINGDNYQQKFKRGDYFFLPFSAENKFTISTNSKCVLIECLPSKQDK